MADEYPSGNVVEKLAEAIEAAWLDDSLRRNVEALEKAQPERLGSQIGKLRASWVPAEHVQRVRQHDRRRKDVRPEDGKAGQSKAATSAVTAKAPSTAPPPGLRLNLSKPC